MDHLKLLCDFGELNWVFTATRDIQGFLDKIVVLVRQHMEADVCAIYLYDASARELVLKAAGGTEDAQVGQVRLRLGEGLSGRALQQMSPIRTREGRRHPAFRYVPGLDRFDNYMAMPIVRGNERIGALTLQRQAQQPFDEQDERALKVIAAQLANILANARLLALGHGAAAPAPPASAVRAREPLRCSAASEGCAAGPAVVYDRDRSMNLLAKSDLYDVSPARFQEALAATEAQLQSLQAEVEKTLDDAASLIFSSHLLILKDPVFLQEINSLIRKGAPAPAALVTVARRYMNIFSRSPNPYVQEKVQDIKDLVIRIGANLMDQVGEAGHAVSGRVVIARELLPSDVLKLATEKAAGILQVAGGVTSHVSILARSLRIPLVIADRPDLMEIPDGTPIYLDGDTGNVYVDPPEEVVHTFAGRLDAERRTARGPIRPETRTADGERVKLLANINLFSDMRLAMQIGAEGVGLYRTEFPFLIRNDFPSEEEQYVIYRRVVEAGGGRPIVFRTLDVGGDKALAYGGPPEANPFLGLRSIRFSLQHPQVFREQVRAIMRACAPAPATIMFPMISSPDEFAAARQIVVDCASDLGTPAPRLGTMVELPSVVEIVEELARSVEFFSIGTNDFVQYMLGVDRGNEKVAEFYIPHHPAVLRALRRVTAAAQAAGREVSVCGEMAHERRYLAFLLGIGVRVFSMDAGYLPEIQEFVSGITVDEARGYAARLLAAASVEEATRNLSYTDGLEATSA